MVSVPALSCEQGVQKQVEVNVPVIDVHELLWYLHSKLRIRTSECKVREYWEHQRNHRVPHAVNFPCSASDRIPFSLYGDECSLQAQESGTTGDTKVTAIFLSLTLFKPKTVKHGHYLIFAMRDSDMVHDQLATLRPVLRHIVWSSNLAYDGYFPSTTMDGTLLVGMKLQRAGQPLAGGRKFACCELKEDWLYHQRMLRLQQIPVSKKVCFLCDACSSDSSNMVYYDDAETAAWRSTEVTTAAFIMHKVRPDALRHLGCNHAWGIEQL